MTIVRTVSLACLGPMLACAVAPAFARPTTRVAPAGPQSEQVPTGQTITPLAAPGAIFGPLAYALPGRPGFTAGQASNVALSPDGRRLLILTSGYNKFAGPDGKPDPAQSNEYVFIYDVSGPRPVRLTTVTVPNSFIGLGWALKPDASGADTFYVSGGVDDDVLEFREHESPVGVQFGLTRTFALGHKAGLGKAVKPEAAGLAVSPDGTRLLVANVQNDSVSLIDLASGKTVAEQDLRPGAVDPARHGVPGGSFPRSVAWTAPDRAFVGAERDREVIALHVGPADLSITGRTALKGQPTALAAAAGGRRLLVTEDDSDALTTLDAATGAVLERTPTAAPAGLVERVGRLGGAGSNDVTVSPDGRIAYVTNGGQNAVAVVRLGAAARGEAGAAPSTVAGLIPTGWYPTAVTTSRDGSRLYVVNGKSNPGPNPDACRNTTAITPGAENACKASGQYVWQLEKAGFLALPTPSTATLAGLTRRVARNDGYGDLGAYHGLEAMAGLRSRIKHVIYIVKENRTYDQVLGDLRPGNGDAHLALFPEPITPNHHALARDFVTLDAFRDSGESSNTGWNWTTAARTNDWTEREAPVNYAQRGLQYDQEGQNRNVAVAVGGLAERRRADPDSPNDPDVLAGPRDVGELDGPGADEGHGYLWDAAQRAGLSLRNWGFYGNLDRYDPKKSSAPIPLERDPHRAGLQVFFPNKPALAAVTDPYYRGFDQAFPDYWRFQEWKREFDAFSAKHDAPALMLLRLPHDHFGSFDRAIDGVNTVETEIADNDYALGLIIQTVAQSPFAADTLVFVVEDDAQDGADHVDAHRSIALIAGPYVRQHAVVSTRYTTVNLVRTIEEVLGLPPMNLNDAHASPMDQVFDMSQASWSYRAVVPGVLRTTQLPLPAGRATACLKPRRSSAWWAAAMAGQDFSSEDKLDTPRFNRALWRGLRGAEPYPARRVKSASGTAPTTATPCA